MATRQVLYHGNCVSALFILFYYLIGSTGVWTQGLTLARQALTAWASPPALFCDFFFKIGSHKLFAWGWLWTAILLISDSWVAKITGVRNRHLALFCFWDRISLTGTGLASNSWSPCLLSICNCRSVSHAWLEFFKYQESLLDFSNDFSVPIYIVIG
jgi:hypothetical protein